MLLEVGPQNLQTSSVTFASLSQYPFIHSRQEEPVRIKSPVPEPNTKAIMELAHISYSKMSSELSHLSHLSLLFHR